MQAAVVPCAPLTLRARLRRKEGLHGGVVVQPEVEEHGFRAEKIGAQRPPIQSPTGTIKLGRLPSEP